MTSRSLLRAAGIAARSLFVQASWNFERMQNLGYFLMVEPSVRRRESAGAGDGARMRARNLGLFNTHPYFAPLVAGTVSAEEEAGSAPEVVEGLRRSLMCSLAGIGDGLFWAHLRPLTLLIALPAALLGEPWAPLLALATYNVPHLGVRFLGAALGLSRGRRILGFLQARMLTSSSPVLAVGIVLLAGFAAGLLATMPAWGLPALGAVPAPLAGAGAFAVLVLLAGLGLRPHRIVGALSLLAVLGAAVLLVGAP